MMKKYLLAAAMALSAAIAGCGGGETSGPMLVVPPTTSEDAIVLSVQSNSISVSNGDFLVRFGGPADVAISGSDNNVTFALNQEGGVISVSGNGNTLIFRPGATASSLTVSGSNNTIYIADDSGITVSGTPGPGLAIKIYPH